MPYKAIILDVDGTLVAHGEPSARPAVAEMVRRVQALGVKVVIATGRTYYAMNTSILGGIKPDYAVCANGAQVLDDAGRLLASGDFTPEEMYALVDYFEDFDYPLAFAFSDSYYVYVEFEKMREFYKAVTGHSEFVLDGEDQERHLQDMPFGAFGILPPEAVEGFQARDLAEIEAPVRPSGAAVRALPSRLLRHQPRRRQQGGGGEKADGAHRLESRRAFEHGRQRERHPPDAAGGPLLLHGQRHRGGQSCRQRRRRQ